MNIDELTYGEIKQIAALANGHPQQASSHPYEIGKPYFIRSVNQYNTGILKAVTEHELVLTEACWIADTGRFSEQFAKEGDAMFDEVEPWPVGNEVVLGRGAIIDATQINKVPASKK